MHRNKFFSFRRLFISIHALVLSSFISSAFSMPADIREAKEAEQLASVQQAKKKPQKQHQKKQSQKKQWQRDSRMMALERKNRILEQRLASLEVKLNTQEVVESSEGEIKVANKIAGAPALPAAANPAGVAPFHGPSVRTAPYLGIFSEEGDQSLLVSLPDVDQDYQLLEQMHTLEKRSRERGITVPYPRIDLSGLVAVTAFFEKPYSGHHTSDIDVNDAKLDIIGEVNRWATANIGLNYDSSVGSNSRRVGNSRVFVDTAFLVFGNLDVTSFYAAMGQLYVPFGDHRSYLISDPLSLKIGKTNARTFLLGYHQQGSQPNHFYADVYAFQGDSRVGAFDPDAEHRYRNDRINNWGINLGQLYECSDRLSLDVRAGYLANLADSKGLQNTSGLGFGGFGLASVTEVLDHRVPGLSLFARGRYEDYVLIAEWVGAARHFNRRDMSYDHRGAKPKALHIEGARHFNLTSTMPASWILGYDRTYEAIALGLPRQRYLVGLNVNVLRRVLAALEIRHDKNYGPHRSGTGSGLPMNPNNVLGRSATRITTLIQYEF